MPATSLTGEDNAVGRLVVALVVSALVVCSGVTLRMSYEALKDPEPAEAQSPSEGDLYDCSDFSTSAEAQAQLLPGDP
jgi:hypothetical protein